jgi:hypothetical protein
VAAPWIQRRVPADAQQVPRLRAAVTAFTPHLRAVMSGPEGWESSETVRRAIEIRDGFVQNPRILSFQGREPEYPHRPR